MFVPPDRGKAIRVALLSCSSCNTTPTTAFGRAAPFITGAAKKTAIPLNERQSDFYATKKRQAICLPFFRLNLITSS